MSARKTFYAVAVEEKESFSIVSGGMLDVPLIAKTRRQARQLRQNQDCPESLMIVRCEVVE